ncbi:hypothetical protein AA984_00325 [Brevibacillus formosus]|uniref:HTH araC/xylS-type domain-containing protein n=1 Tax=Brevibacillus formosus TaxID=54913 RepID=A0A837KU97_9BACL|nr:hypothetical protein AA984_00325 [Brevibacillus formosus]
MPPHAYQNLLGINHTKVELAKKRPIANIAVETGFYDQSQFFKGLRQDCRCYPPAIYLTLVQDAIHRGHLVSIATQDERIIGYRMHSCVE